MTPTDPRLTVLLVTAPAMDVARRMAEELVAQRLAACVNIVPGVQSVYRWEGAVECNDEVLMILKCAGAGLPEVRRYLDHKHPYDVPECVAFEPSQISPGYAAWWIGALGELAGD